MQKKDHQDLNTTKPKVLIETAADLYNLSLPVIKNTKLYDFKGKYFDKIYQEALKIERSGGLGKLDVNRIIKKTNTIDKIIFEIAYRTDFGKRLGILGSLDQLGNWDTKRVFILSWTKSDVWTGEIQYHENTDFEYKFVFMSHDRIQKWEIGGNRVFKYDQIKSLLEKAQKNEEKIQIENFNYQDLYYDCNANTLKIVSRWK